MASQILTVLSYEFEAMYWPSGEYMTDQTMLLWPVMTRRRAPVEMLHSRIVESNEPETSRSPSGEKAIQLQLSVRPPKIRTHGLHVCSRPSLTSIPGCKIGPYSCDSRD